MLDDAVVHAARDSEPDVVRVRTVQPRALAVEDFQEREDFGLKARPVGGREASLGAGVRGSDRAGGIEDAVHLGVGDAECAPDPAGVHPGGGGRKRAGDGPRRSPRGPGLDASIRKLCRSFDAASFRPAHLDRIQPGESVRAGAPAFGGERVDDGAAAHRAGRRLVADDDAVARECMQGAVEHDLDRSAFSGRDAACPQHRDPCG
ncbi:MAG: hypothetical protein OXD35_13120 [Thiotrichales bacterium]|nr:hypothetical protein [Thiotrichales bacterium]